MTFLFELLQMWALNTKETLYLKSIKQFQTNPNGIISETWSSPFESKGIGKCLIEMVLSIAWLWNILNSILIKYVYYYRSTGKRK